MRAQELNASLCVAMERYSESLKKVNERANPLVSEEIKRISTILDQKKAELTEKYVGKRGKYVNQIALSVGESERPGTIEKFSHFGTSDYIFKFRYDGKTAGFDFACLSDIILD